MVAPGPDSFGPALWGFPPRVGQSRGWRSLDGGRGSAVGSAREPHSIRTMVQAPSSVQRRPHHLVSPVARPGLRPRTGGFTGKGADRDHLYSVSALTNASGVVVERYGYDAYGKRIILDGAGTTVRTVSSYGNNIGFTGRERDSETGLWYFRARMYSDGLGRFVSRDPAGYVDGFGLYSARYVPNNSDWSGKVACDPHWEPQSIIYGIAEATADNPNERDRATAERVISGIAGRLKKCQCVDYLVLNFHSRNNGELIQLEDRDERTYLSYDHTRTTYLMERTADEFGRQLAANVCFCKPCHIVLASCLVGNGDIGAKIAAQTGCSVISPQGFVQRRRGREPWGRGGWSVDSWHNGRDYGYDTGWRLDYRDNDGNVDDMILP